MSFRNFIRWVFPRMRDDKDSSFCLWSRIMIHRNVVWRPFFSLPVGLLLGLGVGRAEVKVSNLFGDHMVLQRDIPAPIWGTAEAGEGVKVKFGGNEVATQADPAGKWTVKLPPQKANATPQDLTIEGKNTLVIRDVLVGDVWICSGQSNMEWNLGGCNAPEDVQSANVLNLRRIKFNHVALAKPSMDIPGKWENCTPATAGGFTAVGYYFARRIQKEVDVPIGLLDDNWGGCVIEPWIPKEGFELYPHEPLLAKCLEIVKNREAENSPPNAQGNPVAPSTMYNGMLHGVVPFGIKGALWYQGESNGGEGDEYYAKMRALIEGWRKIWNQGEFPFYFVQLANWQNPTDNPQGGDGWARCRMAQTKSLQIPRTGMAVTIDIGEGPDIHPKNKFDVGERLALWALKNDYGKSALVVSGPLYKSMKIEGGKIRVDFDHAANGLIVGKKEGRKPTEVDVSGKLARFAIAGEDKKWVWADAVIEGNSVIVSSPSVASPVAVRYAFSMNPQGCNLYNKEGLPASPFRTDNW